MAGGREASGQVTGPFLGGQSLQNLMRGKSRHGERGEGWDGEDPFGIVMTCT